MENEPNFQSKLQQDVKEKETTLLSSSRFLSKMLETQNRLFEKASKEIVASPPSRRPIASDPPPNEPVPNSKPASASAVTTAAHRPVTPAKYPTPHDATSQAQSPAPWYPRFAERDHEKSTSMVSNPPFCPTSPHH